MYEKYQRKRRRLPRLIIRINDYVKKDVLAFDWIRSMTEKNWFHRVNRNKRSEVQRTSTADCIESKFIFYLLENLCTWM